jgi:hypothetical protein
MSLPQSPVRNVLRDDPDFRNLQISA